LFIAVLAVATSAPLVRAAAPAPALVVAALRVLLAGVVFAIASGASSSKFLALPQRQRLLAVLSSLLLAIHFGTWIASLSFTSVAASTALVATQPVWAALFGWMLLGEPVARREWLGIGIATMGCAVLAGGDWVLGGEAILGDALAIIGAVSAAAYFTVGRSLRDALPLTPYLAVVHVGAGIALLIAMACAGKSPFGLPPASYAAIAACALLPSAIGHSLLNWCVRRVRVHLVTLAILGEPIGASILTYVFFDEIPTFPVWLGGAIALTGIAIGFLPLDRETRASATNENHTSI
jgi:drug/metabolite transporter (DMT)-like permease